MKKIMPFSVRILILWSVIIAVICLSPLAVEGIAGASKPTPSKECATKIVVNYYLKDKYVGRDTFTRQITIHTCPMKTVSSMKNWFQGYEDSSVATLYYPSKE